MRNYTDYRPNVAAIILSSEYPKKCEFMISRRNGMKRGWQFPQGGIDEGESNIEALMRELKEEIGTNEVEILGEYPEWITYDFPQSSKGKLYPYKGQTQKYFLVRLREGAKIDLFAHEIPEFEEYRFVGMNELFKRATFLKRRAYRRVIDYFKKEGIL
jgi:putative (di)nucleoside polyphosphate hydrolase